MITVIQAIYASNNKGIDVTSQAQSILSGGNDDITASNSNFGDPDPGSKKYFIIFYTAPPLNNGNPIGLACAEGNTIDLVPSSGAPPYCSTPQQQPLTTSSSSAVTVNRAVYGTGNNGLDVTAICQALFNQGAFGSGTYTIQMSNAGFGGDPDSGPVKAFAMQYQVYGGAPSFIGAQEGQTLNLPIGQQSAAEIVATAIPAPVA